jgi:taurine dehydrogenase small subunit
MIPVLFAMVSRASAKWCWKPSHRGAMILSFVSRQLPTDLQSTPANSAIRRVERVRVSPQMQGGVMKFESDRFIERFWHAFNGHASEDIAALMTADALLETSFGGHAWGDRIVGRAAIRDFYVEMFARIPDARWIELRRVVGPTHIVLESFGTGTPTNGKPFESEICDILTLRDGLIAAKRSYRKVAAI